MKYRDPNTGELKDIYVKASDTLPIGTIVDYDGDTVPDGYEEVENEQLYSITPKLLGKWIDGKRNIYQAYINGTINSTNQQLTDYSVDALLDVKGYIYSSGNQFLIGKSDFANESGQIVQHSRVIVSKALGGKLRLDTASEFNGCSFVAIVEYVKAAS